MAYMFRALAGLISIHALHEESDIIVRPRIIPHHGFQSTLSMRRATLYHSRIRLFDGISIHALHEESDTVFNHLRNSISISIHALHEESDMSTWIGCSVGSFQSTLSMRRAT